MAEKVLILGESGSGKTFSMYNMDEKTTAIVSPEKVRLPFRKQFRMLTKKTDSRDIIKFMKDCVKDGIKAIIIDDVQYILAIPYMHRIQEKGWDKFNDFGQNYFDIMDAVKDLPDDVIVYFMSHTETLDDGTTAIKLIGKILREKITIEGLFTIVLRTNVTDGKNYFITQNSGKDTVKTPFGMFDSYAIQNDLNYVDQKIRSFYYMEGSKSDAEMKASDEAVKGDLEKPEAGRRGRRSRNDERHEETKKEVQETLEKLDQVAGDRDEVPFEELTNPDPEPEKPSRRTRRSKQEPVQEEVKDEPQEEEKQSEKPVRRSRRSSEPVVYEQEEQQETAPEEPKRRTRRSRN